MKEWEEIKVRLDVCRVIHGSHDKAKFGLRNQPHKWTNSLNGTYNPHQWLGKWATCVDELLGSYPTKELEREADNRINQRRAWLLLGWVTAERSCPCKQSARLAISGGSEVIFKPLDSRLVSAETQGDGKVPGDPTSPGASAHGPTFSWYITLTPAELRSF
ncbi:hypothetical protein J6590_047564 [Homalodisca vitripennis]|nr:hypothetical protein J6590_047564 [Homalodisca vitripennis]